MTYRGMSYALGVAFWAILFSPAAALPGNFLCLDAHPGGQRIAAYPVDGDAGFALGFIHSVSRTPVLDTYRIAAQGIVQTSEVFEAHGAGLPSLGNEMDATGWRHENGRFILDLDRPIGTMIVRVQAEFKNTLHIADRTIPLAALGQSALRVSACDPQE